MAAEPTPAAPVVPFPRAAGAPKTLAAIDVGSNSIKLLVARAEADGRMRVLAREKAMVRLGHETLRTGRLSEEAIAAGVAAIARYAGLARAAEAERVLCVATCAVREAANAGELARRVKQACDLDLEVISGEEEARLVTLAVRSEFPASADPLLVVDIGGGSTEVIVSSGRKTPLAESLALGAVRLTERWVTTDPISKEERKALEAEIDWQLKRVVESVQERGFRTAIGTSGTIAALASMGAALEGRAEAPTGRRMLSARTLKRVVAALTTTSARERAKMPGLESSRADIITAGGILLLRILKRLGVDELVVSDLSLREGLLLDALERAGHPESFLARPGTLDELRAESVRRLAERSALERPHAEATRDLALALFDATHALHQLASREREWLEHAALLHDVGIAVGYRRHHRHTAYLIAHGEMKGFGAQEIEVIAQVARYHRKARPKESHEPFQRLDPWLKPIVEKLSALLRVADGLDGTHRQVVTGIAASVRRRNVVLTVSASANPELEIWTAKKKSALFERVFGRKLEIVAAAPWAAPEPPPD
jgi:exopolyphosphatase/guanosine-5'-triphosphate,3'-diphosphate pyrophosphatase